MTRLRSTCLHVWNARPSCRGWQPGGNPLHGCELPPTHRGQPCRCKCGAVADDAELLPPPSGPSMAGRE